MSRNHNSPPLRMNTDMIVSLVIIMITTLAATVPLYVYTAGQTATQLKSVNDRMDDHRRETTQILLSIQAEMKDFHGRLCAIEERGRK